MNKKLRIIFLGLLLAVCAGCFKEKPLEPLAEDARILAFGDSLTRGKGVGESDSYPAALSRLTGRIVINEGISGELSESGAQRLPPLLDQYRPDLLLLMHGGNDILRNTGSAKAKSNIGSMIERAQAMRIPVVLIGIPERSLFSKTADIYHELAKEYSLVLEDSIISSLLKRPGMKSDAVHFNRAGYLAIAERVVSLLEENGAL